MLRKGNCHVVTVGLRGEKFHIKMSASLSLSYYLRSVEQRSLNSSMSSLVPGTLGHLSQEHLDFYVHWCLLLDLEAKANTDKGGISDLWCKTGHQRYLLC